MAGIFSILWAGAIGGSAAKCAIENQACKKDIDRLPNGVPYWIDRKGRTRLCSNDEIFTWVGGIAKTANTGKVIYDERTYNNSIAISKAEKKGCRYAVQEHPRCTHPATVELSTGKVIAKIAAIPVDNERIEYRKWYLYDCYREKYGPHMDLTYCIKIPPNSVKSNDKGIIITKDEFDNIRNCPGCEKNNFRYHDCYIDNNKIYNGGDSENFKFDNLISNLNKKMESERIRKRLEKAYGKEEYKPTISEIDYTNNMWRHVAEIKERKDKNFRKEKYYFEIREKKFMHNECSNIKTGCCLKGDIIQRIPFEYKLDAREFLNKCMPIVTVLNNGTINVQEPDVYTETVDENECFISGYISINCAKYRWDEKNNKIYLEGDNK